MSPVKVTPQIGVVEGVAPSPFVGPVNHTMGIRITPSNFTAAEIDDYGYLKPGIPLRRDGTLIPTAATPGTGTDAVFGVTVEHVKVLDDNLAATIAAGTTPIEVAVATIAQINRAAVEDILGRALTLDEANSFNRAGSSVKLL